MLPARFSSLQFHPGSLAADMDPDILWTEPKEFYAGGTYQGREAVIDVHEGKIVQMQAYADPTEARKAIGLPHR